MVPRLTVEPATVPKVGDMRTPVMPVVRVITAPETVARVCAATDIPMVWVTVLVPEVIRECTTPTLSTMA